MKMDSSSRGLHFDEYDSSVEDWMSYVERVKAYFALHDVEANKKAAAIISFMGASTYKLLKDLAAPKPPSDLSFEEIVEILKAHFDSSQLDGTHRKDELPPSYTPLPGSSVMSSNQPNIPGAYVGPSVIMQQPGINTTFPPAGAMNPAAEINWMPAPSLLSGCPPGLEYLTVIDQLVVHQKVELLELITGYEMENEYAVKNSMGQMVYIAKEESTFLERNFLGSYRPFDMKIRDNVGNEVVSFHRYNRCDCCCCPTYLQQLDVTSPSGHLLGVVRQEWGFCFSKFRIENESGVVVAKIHGPCCAGCSCSDVNFEITSANNVPIGTITKMWGGWAQETITDATNFSLTFPKDLDAKIKATLLGALILIDYMHFERPKSRNRNSS